MKKILFVILVLLMYKNCYASLFIVVDNGTDEIITMSESNDTILSDGQRLEVIGENWENIDLTYHPTLYKFKNKKFVLNLEKQEKQDKEKKVKDFDVKKCKKDLYEAFKVNIDTYLQIYAPISDFIDSKDFSGLKEYANIMLAANKVTIDDITKFKQVLAVQNIDLDEYGN